MYRLTGDENTVLDLDDMAFVPLGSDRWDLYQEWLLQGNTPQARFTEEEVREQVLLSATGKLNDLTRQANAQVTALAGRVSTLDYLINGQDEEDPDYIAPTAADVAELAQRKTQLKLWNTYNVKLGKVKAAAGWPATPTWPVMPETYTNETSAVSSPTA